MRESSRLISSTSSAKQVGERIDQRQVPEGLVCCAQRRGRVKGRLILPSHLTKRALRLLGGEGHLRKLPAQVLLHSQPSSHRIDQTPATVRADHQHHGLAGVEGDAGRSAQQARDRPDVGSGPEAHLPSAKAHPQDALLPSHVGHVQDRRLFVLADDVVDEIALVFVA
jgi:hypothetical protein